VIESENGSWQWKVSTPSLNEPRGKLDAGDNPAKLLASYRLDYVHQTVVSH